MFVGSVNGLNLGDFSKTVLLDGVDQEFQSQPRFSEITVSDLNDCTLSKMNLARDVLRYDVKEAEFSGEVSMEGLVAKKLVLKKGAQLQGVDIAVWHEEAVRISDPVIKKNVKFESVVVNGALM